MLSRFAGAAEQFGEHALLVNPYDVEETARAIDQLQDAGVTIGGLVVEPFLTVHDAVDPVAVTVTEAATGDRLGVATDLGRATATMRGRLARSWP